MSHFLFAIPNFLRGAASVIDLGGVLEDGAYNVSPTPAMADAKASLADWRAVRAELRVAMATLQKENAPAR